MEDYSIMDFGRYLGLFIGCLVALGIGALGVIPIIARRRSKKNTLESDACLGAPGMIVLTTGQINGGDLGGDRRLLQTQNGYPLGALVYIVTRKIFSQDLGFKIRQTAEAVKKCYPPECAVLERETVGTSLPFFMEILLNFVMMVNQIHAPWIINEIGRKEVSREI
jgi:hypothetical protein